jgi:hypothetical protein
LNHKIFDSLEVEVTRLEKQHFRRVCADLDIKDKIFPQRKKTSTFGDD